MNIESWPKVVLQRHGGRFTQHSSFCLVFNTSVRSENRRIVQGYLKFQHLDESRVYPEVTEPTPELGRFIKERDLFLLDVFVREASSQVGPLIWHSIKLGSGRFISTIQETCYDTGNAFLIMSLSV